MKHKHCEVIKAWADGALIQFKNTGWPHWETCSQNPTWDKFNDYRVKPETLKYRVALLHVFSTALRPTVVSNEHEALLCQARGDFIKWAGDWIEVEV